MHVYHAITVGEAPLPRHPGHSSRPVGAGLIDLEGAWGEAIADGSRR